MAKITMANRTSRAICNSGAIAFKMDFKTTCKPVCVCVCVSSVNDVERERKSVTDC